MQEQDVRTTIALDDLDELVWYRIRAPLGVQLEPMQFGGWHGRDLLFRENGSLRFEHLPAEFVATCEVTEVSPPLSVCEDERDAEDSLPLLLREKVAIALCVVGAVVFWGAIAAWLVGL